MPWQPTPVWLNLRCLRGRSVFVTGAYGLLGGWLVKALHARGARVTVLKRDAVTPSALVLEEKWFLINHAIADARAQRYWHALSHLLCDRALIEQEIARRGIQEKLPF